MELLEIDIAVPRRAFAVRAALSLGAETVAIIGPSGAGKSSLLRAVAGLERDCTGQISESGMSKPKRRAELSWLIAAGT